MFKFQKLAMVKNSKSVKIKFLWKISGNQLFITFLSWWKTQLEVA